MACVSLCLFATQALLFAQTSPATFPDFQLSKGAALWSMALQEDGKLIIGGFFETVNGIPRRNIARLNADGSVDETWDPSANGEARTIVLSGLDVFVLGEFTEIGGQPRQGLAKLSTEGDGSADPVWDPRLGNNLHALLASGPDIYVGGLELLARLGATGAGSADPTWNPTPDYDVTALAIDGTNLYVGGDFTRIGGVDRSRLAKVCTTGSGTVDSMWDPNVSGGNLGYVATLALSGSDLYAGGSFDYVGSSRLKNLAKLNAAGHGNPDPDWNPAADNFYGGAVVYALTIIDSTLYVGGNFDSIGAEGRRNIARLSTTGAGLADPDWNPDANQWVTALAVAGTNLFAAGAFETIGGAVSLSLAKLDPVTGSNDQTWLAEVSFPGSILALARQPDGKIIVGGDFYLAGTFPRTDLARLNPDGTIDPEWMPFANGPVTAVVVSGTNIFVAGLFTSIGGQQRNGLAKLQATGPGAADPAWDPSPDGLVAALAINGSNLFVGGAFSSIGGQPRDYLAKLSVTEIGAADPGWDADLHAFPLSSPWDLPVQALVATDSDVYVAGSFWWIGGQFREGLARIDAAETGLADANWNPSPYGSVSTLALSDTNLFVAGSFWNIGGENVAALAKISASDAGAADTNWNPQVDGAVRLLAISGANLYLGGRFTSVGGQSATNLAKVSAWGTGAVDALWSPNPNGELSALAIEGSDVFAAGDFTNIGDETRYGFALLAEAHAPILIQSNASTIIITRNPQDGPQVSHFQIVAITGGNLYESDGLTPVAVGDFITVAAGEAGLRFVPAGIAGSVTAVSSLNPTPAGAGSAQTTLVFAVDQVAPVLRFNFTDGLTIIGSSGGTYRIESTESLDPPVHWMALKTITLTGSSSAIPDTHPANTGQRFYQAVSPRHEPR